MEEWEGKRKEWKVMQGNREKEREGGKLREGNEGNAYAKRE